MKLAYIILVHKNFNQLNVLINRLVDENNCFFIHVDKRKKIPQKIFYKLKRNKKLYFIKKREIGNWGDIGIVKATINAMLEIRKTNIKFDHIILLSGQDYPIKSNKFINEFYSKNKGVCFMEYNKIPTKLIRYGGKDRVFSYSVNVLGKRETYIPAKWGNSFNFKGKIINFLVGIFVFFKGKRQLPMNLQPYYGSQWWSVSYEAMSYILSFCENNNIFVKYHKYSLLPDEMFFQTILVNSLKFKIINNNFRLINWGKNASSPEILTKKDYEKLKNSSSLFARKFDINIDGIIIKKLDDSL